MSPARRRNNRQQVVIPPIGALTQGSAFLCMSWQFPNQAGAQPTGYSLAWTAASVTTTVAFGATQRRYDINANGTPTVTLGAAVSCTVTATYAGGITCTVTSATTMIALAPPSRLNCGPRTTLTANRDEGVRYMAGEAPRVQTIPFNEALEASVDWLRKNWWRTLIVSAASFIVAWVWNMWLMAYRLEGHRVDPGRASPFHEA